MYTAGRIIAGILVVFVYWQCAGAERLVFQGAQTWQTWKAPPGLTEVGADGQLRLVKFNSPIL